MGNLVDDYSINTFMSYGESELTLDEEIRADIIKAIKQAVTSTMFNRSDGSGIEFIENEVISVEAFIIMSHQVATNIANYNASAELKRQVAFSQEFIEVQTGSNPGEMYINIRYLPLKDARVNNAAFAVVSVPIER